MRRFPWYWYMVPAHDSTLRALKSQNATSDAKHDFQKQGHKSLASQKTQDKRPTCRDHCPALVCSRSGGTIRPCLLAYWSDSAVEQTHPTMTLHREYPEMSPAYNSQISCFSREEQRKLCRPGADDRLTCEDNRPRRFGINCDQRPGISTELRILHFIT